MENDYFQILKWSNLTTLVTRAQMNVIYANEADVLNVALLGQTHQQWQLAHPVLKGNQRDYADINQFRAATEGLREFE